MGRWRRAMQNPTLAWMVVATLVTGLLSVPVASAEVVAGFETGADLQRWSAQGKIVVQRTAGPPAPDKAGAAPPAGSAARIQTEGNSGLFIKAGELPRDLTEFDALRFWVHRDLTAAAAPSTVEVRFYEADGGAWFWRKVVLDQPGWTQVEVPFKWTRWSPARIPRWGKVNRLGIFFRDAADVFVDSFALADEPPPNGPAEKPVLNPHDVATLAFGAAAADPDKVRIGRAAEMAVITDVRDCESEKLLQHLGNMAAAVKADLPFAAAAASPITLVVFAVEDQYKEFPVKLAERLGAQAAPTTASGYTVQGIATSSWDPRHGTLRPVFAHEFVHALLSATLDLDNKGEWLQEGLASHYQLRFHPQANFRALVIDGLKGADPGVLKQVCSGNRIPLHHYWIAGTLCRMLIEDPDLAAKLPAVVAAIRKSGSTAMEPLLPVLGLSWQELDEKWRAFCQEKYGT